MTVSKNAKGHYVFSFYVTRNGVKIYRKNGRPFRFWVAD